MRPIIAEALCDDRVVTPTQTFFTIGHSNRSLEAFVELLRESAVMCVVDIRKVPRSRANPQFNEQTLPQALAGADVGYRRLPALGGLRARDRSVPPEVNGLWVNESFHNYADYALSAEFHAGLDALRQEGRARRCAIMCSEAVWWRCHRRIVADYLIAHGDTVVHIMGPGRLQPARVTPGARVQPDGAVMYPAAQQSQRTEEHDMTLKTIGLIGAGHIGSQLARLLVRQGYDVVLSNSRGPDTLRDLVRELGPHARAGTPAQAAEAGDIVVVTIPLKHIADVPAAPLAGKIVIDTNNYYPQRDGHIGELDREETTTSELLQRHLPRSKVVKAFNHIYAHELTTHGQPAGTPDRRALAIAGDDAEAKRVVTRLIDQFGFDVVDIGPLAESWRIQRDTPGYGPRRTAAELRRDITAAERPIGS